MALRSSCDLHEVFLKLVVINMHSNHCRGSFLSVLFFENGMSCRHKSRSSVPNVKRNGEDEAAWVVVVILHSPLVPHLISGLVVQISKMPENGGSQ